MSQTATKTNTPAPAAAAKPAEATKSEGVGGAKTATTETASTKPRIAPELTSVRTDIPMPTNASNRGSKSPYDFDSLTVGGSFGVKNKTAEQLASIVSNQNKKHKVPKKDENGNIIFKMNEIKDQAGNVSMVPTKDAEMVQGKFFFSANVDPKTDPDGATVRIWRKF